MHMPDLALDNPVIGPSYLALANCLPCYLLHPPPGILPRVWLLNTSQSIQSLHPNCFSCRVLIPWVTIPILNIPGPGTRQLGEASLATELFKTANLKPVHLPHPFLLAETTIKPLAHSPPPICLMTDPRTSPRSHLGKMYTLSWNCWSAINYLFDDTLTMTKKWC